MLGDIDPRAARRRRHRRVRLRVRGTPARPRLAVFRSLKHIYAQLVNDGSGQTLMYASSLDQEVRGKLKATKVDTARAVGELLAQRAVKRGVSMVVFDRGGYLYHGRVKALAEGARVGGLGF